MHVDTSTTKILMGSLCTPTPPTKRKHPSTQSSSFLFDVVRTNTVITIPDARLSVNGSVLTINPSSNLLSGTDYAIQISANAVEDLSPDGPNTFLGILDNTTWKDKNAIRAELAHQH